MVVDATYGEGHQSLTLVQRTAQSGVLLGVTSRTQLDRKGSSIPCEPRAVGGQGAWADTCRSTRVGAACSERRPVCCPSLCALLSL
jgi:hypothetical protein